MFINKFNVLFEKHKLFINLYKFFFKTIYLYILILFEKNLLLLFSEKL